MNSCRHILPRHALRRHVVAPAFQARFYRQGKALVTTINDEGVPVSSETEIRIGDPDEAYICVMPDIGNAIKASVIQQTGKTFAKDAELVNMKFDHAARSFTPKDLPFPRIEINHDLPRQTQTESGVSPARLWLSANLHSITLNGSSDEEFEYHTRQSVKELKHTLDLLKDA